MNRLLPPLSARPDDRDDPLIRTYYRSEGVFPKKTWIVGFESRDAIREFNGDKWSIIADLRQPPAAPEAGRKPMGASYA